MILLQTVNVSKSFGADPILSDISLQIQTGDRIGLVGVNGAGKSTLLKIITGQMLPDQGEVRKSRDIQLIYLAQDSGLESDKTIWDEMISVFAALQEKERELREIEASMGQKMSEQDHERLLQQYAILSEEFSDAGGYQYEANIRGVLHGLRFYEDDYGAQISSLSGGQKTRLALCKLLLTQPEVLVLDEPTNYLDIETLTWMERYLHHYSGAVLVVSHDRYFLDALVTMIYEIERTQCQRFVGNYTKYLEQKAEQIQRQMATFEKQQAEINRMEDFIARNIARASTTGRAQSRRRMLDKIDRVERPISAERRVHFTFDIDRVSGNEVLKINNLSIGYPLNTLSSGLSFDINRGERVALLGPNGIGKSTLLKTIIGELSPLKGDFQLGSNVSIGYYDQEQQELDSDKTVLHELWDEYRQLTEQEIRTVLGNFLFSGDDVLKKVSALSGGEKARISLAKLMLQNSNFLILDEPTNHLDIYSKEVLENALEDYPGTILFVSHDRYFLNRMATRVIELSASGSASYLGNYDYYVEKKQELDELGKLPAPKEKAPTAAEQDSDKKATDKEAFFADKEQQRIERQRKRKIEEVERQIDLLESKISDFELELCKPEVFEDPLRALEINEQLESKQQQVEELMFKWEQLQEEN
ncbi:multidrug ABC transporter ATP-binding protein [Ammoniphilus oxalaticus]|uniref:Multidrug ABC transporter ATP-binding protein n=1 Tax=Ammoniphilus oxalaticus TaxID=66863 RepID=A0A419SFQ6_9BACL|nr:ABC-F family ATP-binding cassette domain-containing protein [Ammoniphilus oxalaticus]RKD22595.1 multidrug ABC transporter ATP-binding protein [Ammoniphilus oxalaticus]